jgi:hypothetical protein
VRGRRVLRFWRKQVMVGITIFDGKDAGVQTIKIFDVFLNSQYSFTCSKRSNTEIPNALAITSMALSVGFA